MLSSDRDVVVGQADLVAHIHENSSLFHRNGQSKVYFRLVVFNYVEHLKFGSNR